MNNYERDHKARLQCIMIHGTACAVCGIDFEKMYGELGKGFIHVHHIVPIHTIGQGYKVDPANDLVPVCPNCHAMLHRGMNGEARSIEELKSIIKNLNTEEFKRIKVGIGHSQYNVIDYVLSKPSKEEKEAIEQAQDNAVKAIKIALKENFDKAMNQFNK